jgi:hypothetical protein
MSNSSILGGERVASRPKGHDADTLGPSDSSDSGSDIQGERVMPTGADAPDEWGALPMSGASDSDASGTGERGSATGDDPESGADILPDRIVDASGLDDDLVSPLEDAAELAADEEASSDEEDAEPGTAP